MELLLWFTSRFVLVYLTMQSRKVRWKQNNKLDRFGRKRLRPNQSYQQIFLEGLRKHTKSISQDNRCISQDSDKPPPECKSRELPQHKTARRMVELNAISDFAIRSIVTRVTKQLLPRSQSYGKSRVRGPSSSIIKFPIPSPKAHITVYKDMVKNK